MLLPNKSFKRKPPRVSCIVKYILPEKGSKRGLLVSCSCTRSVYMFPAGDVTYSVHLVHIFGGLEVHKDSVTEEQQILPDNQIASLIFLCINSIHAVYISNFKCLPNIVSSKYNLIAALV